MSQNDKDLVTFIWNCEMTHALVILCFVYWFVGVTSEAKKTEYKVYLFVTSNILMNTRMNLTRDLMSLRGDSIRDTNHLMNLVGRVKEKWGRGLPFK